MFVLAGETFPVPEPRGNIHRVSRWVTEGDVHKIFELVDGNLEARYPHVSTGGAFSIAQLDEPRIVINNEAFRPSDVFVGITAIEEMRPIDERMAGFTALWKKFARNYAIDEIGVDYARLTSIEAILDDPSLMSARTKYFMRSADISGLQEMGLGPLIAAAQQ